MRRARESEEGAGGALPSVAFRTRNDGRAPGVSRPDPERLMLVVWQRREAVEVPLFRQMSKVGPGDQEAMAES